MGPPQPRTVQRVAVAQPAVEGSSEEAPLADKAEEDNSAAPPAEGDDDEDEPRGGEG